MSSPEQKEKDRPLLCMYCGRETDSCAFCECEDCKDCVCFRCMNLKLRQSVGHLHEHGG